MKKFVNLGH